MQILQFIESLAYWRWWQGRGALRILQSIQMLLKLWHKGVRWRGQAVATIMLRALCVFFLSLPYFLLWNLSTRRWCLQVLNSQVVEVDNLACLCSICIKQIKGDKNTFSLEMSHSWHAKSAMIWILELSWIVYPVFPTHTKLTNSFIKVWLGNHIEASAIDGILLQCSPYLKVCRYEKTNGAL